MTTDKAFEIVLKKIIETLSEDEKEYFLKMLMFYINGKWTLTKN